MNEVECYIERLVGYDQWGVWFFDEQRRVARVEDGQLVWSDTEPYVEQPPTLRLNGRWEGPALLAALENTETANTWKARYEELAAQLELAESRVDRIIDKALG